MKQEVQCSSLPFKQQKFYGQNALLDALMVQAVICMIEVLPS
jgi:hypothetical protein